MATKYWLGNDSGNEGDLNVAANWDPSGVPSAGDDVIFDGRSTEDADASLTTFGALELGSLTVRSSFTGSIGTYSAGASYDPLMLSLGAGGRLEICGTGTYRIQCGKGAADCTVAETIINTASGTVYLSSEKNASLGNVSKFTIIRFLKGTLYLHGDSEKAGDDGHGGDSGTAFGTLFMVGYSRPYAVSIADKCKDFKNATEGTIYMNGGILAAHCALESVQLYGGVFTYGSTAFDIAADDDDIASLYISGGEFNWEPQNSLALPATPVIAVLDMYGGIFDATSVFNTETDDPKITTMRMYAGKVDLRNVYSNFDITHCYYYGGSLFYNEGQDMSFEGGT